CVSGRCDLHDTRLRDGDRYASSRGCRAARSRRAAKFPGRTDGMATVLRAAGEKRDCRRNRTRSARAVGSVSRRGAAQSGRLSWSMKPLETTVEEVLRNAIQSEVETRVYYQQMAERAGSPEVNKRMLELADAELVHRAKMERKYREVVKQEPPATQPVTVELDADIR